MFNRKFRFSFKRLLPIINFKFDYFLLKEVVKTFNIENFIKILLKSGDILSIIYFIPKFVIRKKGTFGFNLQIKWHFEGAGRSLLCYIRRKEEKQRFLKNHFKKFWLQQIFVGRICFLCFAKQKRNILLERRICKVFVFFYSLVNSTNIFSLFCIKESGKSFRRKGLYYLCRRFKKKRQRLAPLRKMHRKRKKNK